MKRNKFRLNLSKETLRILAPPELKEAVGGDSEQPDGCFTLGLGTCYSCYFSNCYQSQCPGCQYQPSNAVATDCLACT